MWQLGEVGITGSNTTLGMPLDHSSCSSCGCGVVVVAVFCSELPVVSFAFLRSWKRTSSCPNNFCCFDRWSAKQNHVHGVHKYIQYVHVFSPGKMLLFYADHVVSLLDRATVSASVVCLDCCSVVGLFVACDGDGKTVNSVLAGLYRGFEVCVGGG